MMVVPQHTTHTATLAAKTCRNHSNVLKRAADAVPRRACWFVDPGCAVVLLWCGLKGQWVAGCALRRVPQRGGGFRGTRKRNNESDQ